MNKIIFLDIDGPMIPNTAFLFNKHASFDQKLDPRCVEILSLILHKSKAKIVFNSYHNQALYGGFAVDPKSQTPGLVARFKAEGLDKYIHPTVSTKFPYGGDESWSNTKLGRLEAIRMWLQQNGEHNWVALDDEYIEHNRAYTVNAEYGLGVQAYQHCAKWLWHNPGKTGEIW